MLVYLSSDDTCSSNIIDDAIVSFDQIGFLPLSFIVLCGWFILNKCYNFIVKVLLCRLSIKDSEVKRLLTVYWNISFTTITIPFALQALSVSLGQVVDQFYHNLEQNVSLWFTQEAVTVKVRMIYILLTGFFLNKVCQISIEKGFKNVDFVVSEFFAVFFVSTFAYRCIRFGIAFMILYNSAQSLLEFTRMLYCFSKIYPSKFVDFFTRLMFLIHIIFWMVVFFHLIPGYFLMTTMKSVISSIDDASHVLILMLLNAALWGFYFLHVSSSPLSKLIWEFVIQRPCSLERLLFSCPFVQSETQPHMSAETQHNYRNTTKRSLAEKLSKQKSKENLTKVYQTVRCYIRIKRKLNRIRTKLKEEKEQNSLHAEENSKELMEHEDASNEEFPSELQTIVEDSNEHNNKT